ncbi:DUF397 domain-containing protein, partial [Streptomyces sp. NPDC057927]
SSYCGDSSGDCVAVALSGRKSTYSSGSQGDCVEVATCPTTIHIRDSKHTPGPQLALSPTTWTEFVEFAVREGVDGSR